MLYYILARKISFLVCYITVICQCVKHDIIIIVILLSDLLALQDKGSTHTDISVQVSTDYSDKCIQCDYWNNTNISGSLYTIYYTLQ